MGSRFLTPFVSCGRFRSHTYKSDDVMHFFLARCSLLPNLRGMDGSLLHEIEIAMVRLPPPPRLPGWRKMLAARRAERAAVVLFDVMAAREAATLHVHAAATVRPARRRK